VAAPRKRARRIFALSLRKLRVARGLTQEELADAADLHFTYVSKMERELSNVSLDALDKITRALNCRFRDLFSAED
jgi:transcriptional regulator with XRE-family HTH domain